MKYFCLLLAAVALSFSSFAIAPITGNLMVCQSSVSPLSDPTPGGTWSSGSTLIATVGSSTGIVSGLYPGTAIITYKAGTLKSMVTVTVNATAPVIGNTTVCAGLTTILSDAIYGGTWSSKDLTLATTTTGIANVAVNAIAAGNDTIFYTYPSGCRRFAIVNIVPLPDPITGNLTICYGEKTQLSSTTPNGVWSSSVPGVATVGISSGVATGVAAGTTIISYTGLTTCVRTAVLTINPLPAPIAGVRHAYQGNSTILSDAVTGGVWSDNFPAIATIDPSSGLTTGISSGVATVSYQMSSSTGCRTTAHYVVNGFPDSAGAFPISGWYPFCGNFSDHSTSIGGSALTVPFGGFNSPQLTTDRFGVANNAYHFRGQDPLPPNNSDALRHPFFSAFTPTGTFTYSCWVKFNYTGNPLLDQQNAVILFNGIESINGIGLIISDGSLSGFGTKITVVEGGVGTFLGTDPYATPALAALNINGWVHLYLERVATAKADELRFYINNVFIGAVPQPSYPFIAPNTLFQLGADVTTGGSAFVGDIDDVAMFNSSLTDIQRTETQIFNPDAPVFTLGPDVTICNDAISLYPTPVITGRIYTWSTGDTLSDTITVIPPARATTPYTLTISQPYGCDGVSTINVTTKPLLVNIGVDTNICTGDTILLHTPPKFSPSAIYAWSTGSTSDTIRVTATGTYILTVFDSSCTGHDTAFVAAQVTPIVDLGPDIFNCQGQPDTMVNLYQDYDKTFTYLWSNGSSLATLTTNVSGSFWLQVTNNGCSRADTIKALIVMDTFSFYSHDTAICLGRFVTGLASFNPIVSYQWTPTTGVPLSTLPTTNITPDTSATYYLIGSYPGCPDIINSFHIDVQPEPIVFMGGNRNVCQFDTININAQVSPNWYKNYIFNWSPAARLDNPTRQTVILTAIDTLPTPITQLFVTVTTTAGCTGSDSALIVVHPGNFDSSVSDIKVCPGDVITLTPNMYYAMQQASVTATYLWQPGKYVSDSTATTPLLKAVTSEKFRAIGTSQYGCRDTFTFDVHVEPGAVLYLGDSAVLHPGETYQANTQTNCDFFHWFPTTGVSDTNSSNPVLSPLVSTRYIVRAETEGGCMIVDSIDIRIDPSTLIDVPNAFAPGSGANNIFYVLKRGIATLNYFRVYNRWGVKVFETNDITKGWDGTYNGQPQPFAVYVYEIEAMTNTGKKFTKAGNVTLLR